MDAQAFQVVARDTAQLNWMAAQSIVARKLNDPDGCDPEFARKVAKDTELAAQALPKDRNDPYANLTVFNIVMGGRGVTAKAVEMADIVEAFSLEAAAPTPAMLAVANINRDVIEMEAVLEVVVPAPRDLGPMHLDILAGLADL